LASLHEKVQNALDEGRILVLGAQVLLGFEFRSFFEPRFEHLPAWAKAVRLVTACVMLLAFALLVLPAAYHRLVAGGEDRDDVLGFTSVTLGCALAPLGLALGLSVGFASLPVLGAAGMAAAAALAASVAMAAWYIYPWWRRRSVRPPAQERQMEATKVSDKIRHVLTEARMVLPGAQALLGFQLAVTLMDAFEKLSWPDRLVHLAALGAVAVAVVLLMTPAAYHRIVERGEETERFHRVASRLVLAGMVAVAIGISLDLYVVAERVLGSRAPAVTLAAAALAVMLGLWFGVTAVLRARGSRAGPPRRAEARA
jgi:cytochrome bd-type quinol oxidase subunit 2